MTKLRDSPEDLLALCTAAAERLGIPEAGFVEKDFWAVEVLRSVSNPLPLPDAQTVRPIFKGGTSLSKAYGLISRFSDDIDMMLLVEGLGSGARDTKVLKPITARVAADLGLSDSALHQAESTTGKKRNTRYYYGSLFSEGPHSAGVLLEMSVRDALSVEPGASRREIRSFIAQYLDQIGEAQAFDEQLPVFIDVLSPVRTLLEKLSAIHGAAVALTTGDRAATVDIGRHYYDVYCLLNDKDTVEELRTRDVEDLCDQIKKISLANRFVHADRPQGGFAESPAFSDAAVMQETKSEYASVEALVYGDFPGFEACIEAVTTHSEIL